MSKARKVTQLLPFGQSHSALLLPQKASKAAIFTTWVLTELAAVMQLPGGSVRLKSWSPVQAQNGGRKRRKSVRQWFYSLLSQLADWR